MTITDIFQGLDRWQKFVSFLRSHKINLLVVRIDNSDIEIRDNAVYVPPHLEDIFKQLLQDTKAG